MLMNGSPQELDVVDKSAPIGGLTEPPTRVSRRLGTYSPYALVSAKRRLAMIDDDAFMKLGAQVQGLELTLKTLVAFQFASRVKGEGDFSKVAEQASGISRRLQAHVASIVSAAPLATHESGVAKIMLEEMTATVSRCFDQPSSMLEQIAQMVLEVAPPASDAEN